MGHRWNYYNLFSTSKWFKILVKFITAPAEARPRALEIIMGTYVEFSVKEDTRRQHGGEPDPRTFKSDRVTTG